MRKAVSFFAVFALLISCKNEDMLRPIEYATYMEDADHDMNRTVKYGAVTYSIQLATPEYVVSKELADQQYSEKEFTDRLNQLEGYTFFYITIAADQNSKTHDPMFAEQRDMYYTQAAASDLSLINNDDELKPVTYHFENNYGLSPYNKLLAAFKTGGGRTGEWQLLFNDRFNENYLIKSSFPIKAITELPKLAIK